MKAQVTSRPIHIISDVHQKKRMNKTDQDILREAAEKLAGELECDLLSLDLPKETWDSMGIESVAPDSEEAQERVALQERATQEKVPFKSFTQMRLDNIEAGMSDEMASRLAVEDISESLQGDIQQPEHSVDNVEQQVEQVGETDDELLGRIAQMQKLPSNSPNKVTFKEDWAEAKSRGILA